MNPQLWIAIDGRSLQGERTGVGTYTSNLLEQLLMIDPSIGIILALSRDPPPPESRLERIQALMVPSAFSNNFYWTNVSLPIRLKPRSFDVFHSPGYTLPIRLPVPRAVTIHDVSYAAHPEWYPHRHGPLRRRWYRASALKAGCILTDSEFSRREIVRVYGIPSEKITVTPLGVDRRKFARTGDPETQDNLKRSYGIEGDFLLFVGDIHRRRNVRRIIEAFGALREKGFPALELVLIGRILDDSVSAREISSIRHGQSIHALGRVPEAHLAAFYSMARAFIFPSFYEGFGLGVAEAMACGCPVITGKGTACEEVAGDAAILVDPSDTKSIFDAAFEILENRELAARYSEAGLRRSERFSWRNTAEKTLAAYRQLASNRGNSRSR